jgi:hypothetical protein
MERAACLYLAEMEEIGKQPGHNLVAVAVEGQGP